MSLIVPQVFQGRLDSLAVATIKALTTVMHKSPAAKVTTTQVYTPGLFTAKSEIKASVRV